MADIVEQRLTPNTPRVIDNQEVKVYTPIARTNQKGIASYDPKDFVIDNQGKVSLKNSLEIQRKNANPLVDADKMEHITEAGHEYDNSVSLLKLLDIEFEHVSEGQYGYDPRSKLGVVKLNRRRLSAESLEKPSLVWLDSKDFYQRFVFDENLDLEGFKSGILWPKYPLDDTTEDVIEDTTRKLGFVMDHLYFDFEENKPLKVSYPIASETSELLEKEKGFGLVRIDTRPNGVKPWLKFEPRDTDGKKDLVFNEGLMNEYLASNLVKIVPNYGNKILTKNVTEYDTEDPNRMRQISYLANFVKPDLSVISRIDGKEYSNGAQLPYGEPYDPDTMVQRTLLLLTKEAIGLDKIPNLDPKAWEVSDPVRTLINILQTGEASSDNLPISKKKDAKEYDLDIGTSYELKDDPKTVKERIANLEAKIKDVSNVSYGFLGYLTIPEGEEVSKYIETYYPVETDGYGDLTHLFVTNTNSLWGWTPTGWINTNLDVLKGDEFQYSKNGVVKSLKVLSQDTLADQEDFITKFNNEVLELKINIPYVNEGKYLHNWVGQLKGGVETFNRGTTTNNLYKKLWYGTVEDYNSEFTSGADDSVLAIISGDTLLFNGNPVDEGSLEKRLENFTDQLLSGSEISKLYAIKPNDNLSGLSPLSGGWGLEEIDLSNFLTLNIKPGVTNMLGAGDENTGILRYNGMDFGLINPNEIATDDNTGITYKTIRETPNLLTATALGRSGERRGAYLILSDLQTNFGEKTGNQSLFKWLTDDQYKVINYPDFVPENPGLVASNSLQTSINKLWNTIINIDTRIFNQKQATESLTSKIGKYPNPAMGAGNKGNYVLSILPDNSSTMVMTNLSSLIGEQPLSEQINLMDWKHGTSRVILGGESITSSNLAKNFEEASKVKYVYKSEGGSEELLELYFWLGTKASYDNLVTTNVVNSQTLYFCIDGYLYFGRSLICKTGLLTSDIQNIVNQMTKEQVQSLLNKLETI